MTLPAGNSVPLRSVMAGMINTAGTYYAPLVGGFNPANVSYSWFSSNTCQQPLPATGGGMLCNFVVSCSVPMASGYTFELIVNGNVHTGIKCVPVNNLGVDTTDYYLFNQFDTVSVQVIQAAGAPSLVGASITWAAQAVLSSTTQTIVLGGQCTQPGGLLNNVTQFSSVQGCMGYSPTYNGPFIVQPYTGTFQNLAVYAPLAVNVGSWGLQLYIETVGQTLLATLSSGNVAYDSTHSVSVTATQYISLAMIPTGAPTAQTGLFWGVEIIGPAYYNLGSYDLTPIAAGTWWNPLSGGDPTGSEISSQMISPGAYSVTGLCAGAFVSLAANVEQGSYVQMTYRINGGDTALAATVTGPVAGVPGYWYEQDVTDAVNLYISYVDCIKTVNTVFAYPAMGLILTALDRPSPGTAAPVVEGIGIFCGLQLCG